MTSAGMRPSSDPRLRAATADDLDEILALIRELAEYERLPDEAVATRDDLATWIFGGEAFVKVTIAEGNEGEIAGMALWFPTFSTWLGRPGIWLEDLFVRQQHRGIGLGRALLTDLFARAQAQGGRVEWAVLDWNQPSIDFYRGLGATEVDGWLRYRWTADPINPA